LEKEVGVGREGIKAGWTEEKRREEKSEEWRRRD